MKERVYIPFPLAYTATYFLCVFVLFLPCPLPSFFLSFLLFLSIGALYRRRHSFESYLNWIQDRVFFVVFTMVQVIHFPTTPSRCLVHGVVGQISKHNASVYGYHAESLSSSIIEARADGFDGFCWPGRHFGSSMPS